MTLPIISVAQQTIKDKETGAPVDLWRVYCVIPETGEVGSFYSRSPAEAGGSVTLALSTDRDGRFTVRPHVEGAAAGPDRKKVYSDGIVGWAKRPYI